MSTCKPTPSTLRPTNRHWLSLHRSGFLESLAAQGHAERTVRNYRRMVDRLCAEAEARGLGPGALDARVMSELAGACPRSGTPHMERELAMATRRFTDHLIRVGAIAAATLTPPPPGSTDRLCADLDRWLRSHAGMYGNRLRTHRKVLRRLVGSAAPPPARWRTWPPPRPQPSWPSLGIAPEGAAGDSPMCATSCGSCSGAAGSRGTCPTSSPGWPGSVPRPGPAISKPASSGHCSTPSGAIGRATCAIARCSC